MAWSTIRLDLARSPGHPEGSHAFSYLLRLPLDANHHVDRDAVIAHQDRATVLRSHPDEPDVHGYVIPKTDGWVLSYAPGDADDEALFALDRHLVGVGEYLTITQSDGTRLPFRIMSCQPFDATVA